MTFNLSELNEKELLRLHAEILNELKQRRIVRTKNNPVGDYTEYLVSKALNLELANKSAAGYDGIDEKGIKYQVKGRRITPENKSRQLSAIRNLDNKNFDFLVGVIFDENYSVIDAVIVPHDVVCEYASFRKHVNGHILHLRGGILQDPRVDDVRELIIS